MNSQKHDQFTVSNDDIESLFVSFSYGNCKFLVGVVYRPPQGRTDAFNAKLGDILEDIRVESLGKEVFIMGDFNINLINEEMSPPQMEYRSNMFSYGYLPLILRPTRVTYSSATLVDNIWCNNTDVSGVIKSEISDHFPIYSNIYLPQCVPSTHVIIKKRVINSESKLKFSSDIQNCDWSSY